MKSFAGKVVAITGAARGIGSATATCLASRGARLSLADMDVAGLESVAQSLCEAYSVDVLTTQVDVADSKQVDGWISRTKERFGNLSGAANIAGTVGKEFGLRNAMDVTDDDFDAVLRVNVRGVMVCQRAQLRCIEEGGAIVNVASVAGKLGQPNSLSYSASKHAVIGLTRVAAAEHGCRNVRVNAVAPGSIDTDMLAHALKAGMPDSVSSVCPMKRIGSPMEVATVIAFLLSPEASFVNGALYSIDGGLSP